MGFGRGQFGVGIPSTGYLMNVRRRLLRLGKERLRDVQLGFEAIDDI